MFLVTHSITARIDLFVSLSVFFFLLCFSSFKIQAYRFNYMLDLHEIIAAGELS